MAESKWLTPNKEIEDLCPVRLFEKMMVKRTSNVKTKCLFLTPNNDRKATKVWYKNYSVSLNQISRWTRLGAGNVKVESKKARITNHFNRSSAASVITSSGANLQDILN